MAIFILPFLAFWFWISGVPTAFLTLDDHRCCTLVFHRWYNGRCVFSCYDDGVCTGTVQLDNGFFEHPLAIFPGPDKNAVVCFSWLDTSYAAFTIDLSKSNPQGQTIRQDLQEAVDWTAFEVRACTQREADFTGQYIKTVDAKTLAHLTKERAPTEKLRRDMLDFFLTATTNATDPQHPLKDVDPQLLPEG